MGAEPRMTMPTLKVLRALLDEPLGEHYGLELASEAGLKSGTIYPILARLERAGWVTSDWETIDPVAEGRRPRRYYRLAPNGTEQARQALREAQHQLAPPSSRLVPGLLRPGQEPA